jgi:hypothetical protein
MLRMFYTVCMSTFQAYLIAIARLLRHFIPCYFNLRVRAIMVYVVIRDMQFGFDIQFSYYIATGSALLTAPLLLTAPTLWLIVFDW